MNETVRNVVSIVMPVLTGVFSAFWPAGMQLPIFMGAIFALTQAMMFRQPWFRNLFGMQPFPPQDASPAGQQQYQGTLTTTEAVPPEEKKMGIIERIKASGRDVVKQGMEITGKKQQARPGRSEGELKKAKEYEAKVRREMEQKRQASTEQREQRGQISKRRQRLR